jgi:hypothetical protein
MIKALSLSLAAILLLSGCSSAPSNPEEASFSEWTKSVYKYSEQKYELNNDVKREAYEQLKPLLDEVALIIGEKRIKVDTSVFNKDDWFFEMCKNRLDSNELPILEPFYYPLVGSEDTVQISGYASTEIISNLASQLGFEMSDVKSDSVILYGSNFEYPYKTVKTRLTKTVGDFRVVIEHDTAWNALIWKSYQEGADPGNYNVDEPFPSADYAPITVKVYFTKSCLSVKPELEKIFPFR